jgi:hypothetical protein
MFGFGFWAVQHRRYGYRISSPSTGDDGCCLSFFLYLLSVEKTAVSTSALQGD